MTDKVDDNVVAINGSIKIEDEADWAIEYARENRRRVKAERRLAGMAYAMGGLIKAVDDVVGKVLEPNANTDSPEYWVAFIKELGSLVMEGFDAEIMTNLVIMDPVWKDMSQDLLDALSKPEDEITATDQRIRSEHFAQTTKFMKENYKETLAEWKLLCQENNMRDVDEVKSQRKAAFAMALMLRASNDTKLQEMLKTMVMSPKR